MSDDEQVIEPGDHVTVGNGTLTWEVLQVRHNERHGQPYYVISSGNYGRTKRGLLTGLKVHTKGTYARSRADHPAGKGRIVTGL